MGYTHYWRTKRPIKPAEMTAIGDDIRKVIAKSKVTIRDWDGTGKPTFTDELIAFNGSSDEAYETFQLTADPESAFCKTEHRPYDKVVVASLLVLKAHLGVDVMIKSDGGPDDWLQGINLATIATGRAVGYHDAVTR